MSQTNAIILRIKADRAKEFEQLFKKHQYPNWVKHHAKGGMLAASLTRVEYGIEEEDAKRGDPDFKEWDEMAEQFQVEGPSVWGGRTILEIGLE
jgi:hypothetical protein